MSRAVWFVAGAATGVYGAFRARRTVESLTPDGLRDRAAGLGVGAQLFVAEVRAGAAEKETELRSRLQPVASRSELGAAPAHHSQHHSQHHPHEQHQHQEDS
ncbi:DUF6167 family protein [Nocardioides marmoraquaticus]